MDRPSYQTVRQQPPERLILLFGIIVGMFAAVASVRELTVGSELDFQAYYFAGRAVLEGEAFVGWAITEGSFLTDKAYVYLPITAPLFSVYGLFSQWYIPYVINMCILFVTFYFIGQLAIRYIERHGRSLERVDRVLIITFCLFSAPSVIGLYRGNIDPIILLLIVGGFLAIERERDVLGGTVWAVAALFKLFPAFLGIWLLYRRSTRGIVAATCVGTAAVLASLLLFGVDTHLEFIEFILTDRSREGAFIGGVSPTAEWITLRRPLSQISTLTGRQLYVISLVLLAPFLVLLYWRANSEVDRLAVFTATLVVLLITIVPSTTGYVVYLLFSLVTLVYLIENRAANACFLAGLVLINVPLYPQHIEQLLEITPLSPASTATITDLSRSILTYGSIGLWGFLLVLAGCLLAVCLPRSDYRTVGVQQ